MGRFFIILAVIFALVGPASGAFAAPMMLKCKCPDMSQCSDHECGAAACHASTAPTFSPVYIEHVFSPAGGGMLFVAALPVLSSALLSSPFKPPR